MRAPGCARMVSEFGYMKTYTFRVVVEPDQDFDGNPSGWHAYCPVLEQRGAWLLRACWSMANPSLKDRASRCR